ncbi:hypothetical protein LENED_010898 [Lentinula edodes]|uniref:Zn(2)-C6 fungal-type domain-containing protein n=1 Tax=Lentinula edodes TaxID=5353 RepID=A0A1Q3ENL4_LENED|nr:hypothetical protein LENED_010898 [Lentinula edodes]
MSTSRTTTTTSTTIGSIPVTGRQPTPPAAPTRPSTPDPSDEERELELQLERTREKNRRRKEEKKKAEEEARRKAEEEKKRQEAAARAADARRIEEEAAEKRRKIAAAAAARNRRGPSPGEASTSARRVEVEIPRVVKKGKAPQRNEVSGRDPDDGDDGENDDEDDEERAPCERCFTKKIPCLEQVGKRSTVICKACHDAKVKCSYSGRPVQVKREGGPGGERMAVMESQLAQLMADNRALREATSRSHQYLRQLLRRQDEDHARLIAIDTRDAMRGAAVPGPSRSVSERPRNLKRRRIVENSEEEEEEEDKGGEEVVEGEKGKRR